MVWIVWSRGEEDVGLVGRETGNVAVRCEEMEWRLLRNLACSFGVGLVWEKRMMVVVRSRMLSRSLAVSRERLRVWVRLTNEVGDLRKGLSSWEG